MPPLTSPEAGGTTWQDTSDSWHLTITFTSLETSATTPTDTTIPTEVPTEKSQATKDTWAKTAAAFTVASGVTWGCSDVFAAIAAGTLIIPGVNAASIPAAAISAGCGTFAWASTILAGAFAYLALDPPDPNFTAVETPHTVRAPTVSAEKAFNAADASSLNVVVKSMANIDGLQASLLTAMERAEGAADANATSVVKTQSAAAANFATSLSSAYTALPTQLMNAVRTLRASNLPAPAVPPKLWKAFTLSIKKHGLSSSFVKQLQGYGLGPAAISKIRTSIEQASSVTTNIVTIFSDPSLEAAVKTAAQTFSAYAAAIRAKLATYRG